MRQKRLWQRPVSIWAWGSKEEEGTDPRFLVQKVGGGGTGVIHKLEGKEGGTRFGRETVSLIWGRGAKVGMSRQESGVESHAGDRCRLETRECQRCAVRSPRRVGVPKERTREALLLKPAGTSEGGTTFREMAEQRLLGY